MSDAVVADFVARYVDDATSGPGSEPKPGRIVLNRKGIVLAGSDERVLIPLRTVFDITVGHVPSGMGGFLGDTVTIAYEREDERHVAIVEGEREQVDRFTVLLFKAILNGVETRITHPARIGGRVTDARFRPATLDINPSTVTFHDGSEPISIGLETITYLENVGRDIDGQPRSVLAIHHTDNGRAVTTEFTVGSERKFNLIGRYLHLEYGDLVEQAAEIDVSKEQLEALVAIHSVGSVSALPRILDTDDRSVATIIDSLRKKELVVDEGDSLVLTPQGRMLVNDRIEDVDR